MDENRNEQIGKITWDIFEGDLVKVKKYNSQGELYYQTGIVVPNIAVDQIVLFPYVSVYVFKTNIIEKHLANTVEIISSKTLPPS
tara:strand:+ start:2841 stop:3095 length:255 start_codon:yes stop_codon:yes gene_type:complete